MIGYVIKTRSPKRDYSKGQYRLISEMLLFLLGIMITSYVIVNFNTLQAGVKTMAVKDQMENVIDTVASAIVKVANTNNATIRVVIPGKVSENVYKISIKDQRDLKGGIINVSALDGSVSVERQLFNIDYDNTISSNHIINNSEVVSSAQLIEIIKNEKITISRA
ncbi:MAG: hypothetical protein WC613_05090 [Candidatus Aenigmatarchaeota archaeon]